MSTIEFNSDKKVYDLIFIRTLINFSNLLALFMLFSNTAKDLTEYQTILLMSLALFGFSVGLINKFFKNEEQEIVALKSIGFIILISFILLINQATNGFPTYIFPELNIFFTSLPISLLVIIFFFTIMAYTFIVDISVKNEKVVKFIPEIIKRMVYVKKRGNP